MLISSLKKAKKVIVIGGGYIGMEVAAATVGWNLDTTGMMVDKLEVGSDGRVAAVRLKNESLVEADTAIVGIGAKPAIGPFEILGLKNFVGGIQVDSQFRTSIPGIFSIGDVAGFPLKIYDQMVRVEHVDHARKSAQHCVKALLSIHTQPWRDNRGRRL
ncbi:monodehydroascorbate reductase 5, mitochondrial-like [Amborella trichopoda]|uniref:monodehydroascorbate reductase 5, mitochondrial-like n=1 Tax=Amborella trichopoda TaxID=13333 RepID=UPI0009BDC535|nr:monodehydroascorbate reductase 5, mitochondrial-like [Amborella trichopoda]|eukprot:XP_020527192.1 monodehydroascorbate reductase 5, mitochondrial-like [Amborella trichopoda]